MAKFKLKLLVAATLLLGPCGPALASDYAFAFSPHQGATQLIVGAIEAAKHSIHVAAYQFTSQPVGNALIKAKARGISVLLVCDKASKNNREISYLRDHGIPIRINSRYKIMHNKFIIIDGSSVETGSFNYTAAAENSNAENVLLLRDAPVLAAAYEQQFQKLWLEAK